METVALGSALVLYATGALDAGKVFAGFGDPVVAFVAALFVVSAALQVTGLTAWAGRRRLSVDRARRRTPPAPGSGPAPGRRRPGRWR